MSFKSFRESSKGNWGRTTDDTSITNDDLKTGALLRVADAVEVMSKNHTSLIADRDRYKRWYEEEQARRQKYQNIIRGLRGANTRLKAQRGIIK